MEKNNLLPGRLDQLYSDTESWKRSLRFLAEENIYLKNRLMQVLKQDIDAKTIGEMENFNNKFLRQDERISLLRNTLAGLDAALLNTDAGKADIDKIKTGLKALGNDIKNAAEQSYKLRISFNDYLDEKL